MLSAQSSFVADTLLYIVYMLTHVLLTGQALAGISGSSNLPSEDAARGPSGG